MDKSITYLKIILSMNKKKYFIIAAAVVAVLLINIPLQKFLTERELTRTTLKILQNWKENNLPANYVYWKEPLNSPPIYGLDAYEIQKYIFQKKGDFLTYEFYVKLDFPADNLLPSGKTWIIEYYKFPRLGWLVAEFRQAD